MGDLINRTLTPPDKGGSEYEETERLIKLLEWVKQTYKPEQIFDLYDHDKGVAFSFDRWCREKRWYYDRWTDKWWSPLVNKKRYKFDELWELFCTEI